MSPDRVLPARVMPHPAARATMVDQGDDADRVGHRNGAGGVGYGGSPVPSAPQPLARVGSIKVKLGLLVAASVAVAAVIATVGVAGGVPAILSIPVTIALALAVTQLLAGGMTAPVRAMTQASRRMAAGDYSARIDVTSGDEIGELGRAFNSMARDLATVDRERRELIANVSHELRTPLTALSVRLENLVDGVEPPDGPALGQALEQTGRLTSLVSDLLDLSRLDAGLAELSWTPVDLAEVVGEALSDVPATGREVSFEVRVVPEGLRVMADPARLRQLVVNLAANAARHSPAGGVVRISGSLVGGGDAPRWRLEVTDSGPGISPADRERVFERFGTLAGHQGGGTGLGLAIARWVCTLHGGNLWFVDPPRGAGACARAELPIGPPVAPVPPRPVSRAMGGDPGRSVATAGPREAPESRWSGAGGTSGGSLWAGSWPSAGLAPRPGLLLASVGCGALAAVLVPFHQIGLGLAVVVLVAGAVVWRSSRRRHEPFTIGCAVLAALGIIPGLLRDADWIAVLCLLAGGLAMTAGITGARTFPGFVASFVSWPLSGLRGLGWLGDSLTAAGTVLGRRLGGRASAAPLVRTVLWSVLGVLVFGALFASADPMLALWVRRILPEWSSAALVFRGFVAIAVGGAVLAAAYLACNPPVVEPGPWWSGRRAEKRYEWLVPVLGVNAVFAAFLLAQARVVFGGRDYLRRTTGLTYAEYVHQGFGQLTVATALTLLVVWAASRRAGLHTVRDRVWLRGVLGMLCAQTLVVVASALYRLDLYEDAYGLTRLRLLVAVFEGWLGFVVIAIGVAGIRLGGKVLARVALFTGTATLLGLALVNPDAVIARHNLERYERTGKLDWWYLRSLSADAAPVLVTGLPDADRACLSSERPDRRSPMAWTWGYQRARGLPPADPPPSDPAVCDHLLFGSD
ncbi:MAG: DUF4153 domain-containing protein [Nocardioides sp.]